MFKKTKQLSPPPVSPTVEEILEDMETFEFDQPICEKTRKLPMIKNESTAAVSSTSSTPNSQTTSTTPQSDTQSPTTTTNASDGEWWKTFETFLHDVEEFKDIKSKLLELKDRLNVVNNDIMEISDDMKRDITENLDSARNQLADD